MSPEITAETGSGALGAIRAAQNPDGGWPYRKGGSWTEPTVYALLSQQAANTREAPDPRAITWLQAAQSPDGGWRPRHGVDESTWVTALVALLPPHTIGAERHDRAVQWLLHQTGVDTTPLFRFREFLRQGKWPANPKLDGWPWFPGAAAWVTPTCLGILALRKCYERHPSPGLRERIETAQAFLFSRRCVDAGWNHGSARALGYNSDSYPETTGQVLLALAGSDPAPLAPTFQLAQRFLREHCDANSAAWLRLGLLSHQQALSGAPIFSPPGRSLPDLALTLLVEAAERGYNVFLS